MAQHERDAIAAAKAIMWLAERFEATPREGCLFCKIADNAEAIVKRLEAENDYKFSCVKCGVKSNYIFEDGLCAECYDKLEIP